MLRTVLRNVQYYLLFFSILLVLLAFQRLQWYEGSGFLAHPYGFIDRPMGMRYTPTSPDGGRIYYGGDESKEIGLFKFRLGLFKFILPTFEEEDKWERTNESLMMVPPPPNKRRKSTESLYQKLRAQSQQHAKKKEEEGAVAGKEATKPSVAYVIRVPTLAHLSTTQTSFTKDGEEDGIIQSYRRRASGLSQSIKRAHEKSPYDYQLYVLNLFDGASSSGTSTARAVADGNTNWAREALSQSGFSSINIGEGELDEFDKRVSIESERKLKDEDEQQGLVTLFGQHDVVVQLSLNSLVLKPMDDIFDVLMKGGSAYGIAGVLVAKEDNSDGEAREDGKSTQTVESFALEPWDASSSDPMIASDEIFIFRTTSQRATSSYLKSLQCSSVTSEGKHGTPHGSSGNVGHPGLIPSVMAARKNLQITLHPKQDSLGKSQCKIDLENNFRLRRCIYNLGNSSGRECSGDRGYARVAYFPEAGAATAKAAAGAKDTIEADTTDPEGGAATENVAADDGKDTIEPEEPDDVPQKDSSQADKNSSSGPCAEPWELSSKEDCSQNNVEQKPDEEELCRWLCEEWFDLASLSNEEK